MEGPPRIEPLSFAEGEAEGVAVLYEEKSRALRIRVFGSQAAAVGVGCGLMLFAAILLFILGGGSNPVLGYSVMAGLAVVGIALVYSGFSETNRMTPFRVYENGLSTGEGAKPYYSFRTLRFLEVVADGRRFRTPILLLTFDDGQSILVSRGSYGEAIQIREFEPIRAALWKAASRDGAAKMPWSPEALQFLNSFDFGKAPFIVQLERRAMERGEKEVTLDLIRQVWRDASEAAGGWTLYSVRYGGAAKRFGRNSGRSGIRTPSRER